MPQLQSLHLYIQASVLTEPDLDSPACQSGPMLCSLRSVVGFPLTWGRKLCHHPLKVLSSLPCPNLSI